jgi:4-amino-4-deoxy-L-arabinose transferase-like glycosyltransferase
MLIKLSTSEIQEKIVGFFKGLSYCDWAAILIFLIALFSRLALWEHCLWIDEGRDASIARNLLGNPLEYKQLGTYYRGNPFFYHYLISSSYLIFGISEWSATLVPIIMGSLTVLVIYLIGKDFFNENIGLAAALLLTWQPLHWFYSNRIIMDVPAILFVCLTIYFFYKGYKENEDRTLYLAGISLGLGAMTKTMGIFAGVVIIVFLLFKEKTKWLYEKKYWYMFALAILSFSPWLIWNLVTFGNIAEIELLKAGFAARGVDVGPWYSYVHPDLIPFYNVVTLPIFILSSLGILSFLFIKKGREQFLYLLIWIVVYLLAMSFLWAVKVERYIMPIIPAFCVLAGVAVHRFYKDFGERNIWVGTMIAICVLFYVSWLSYSKGKLIISSAARGFCGLDRVGAWLKENTSPEDVLMSQSRTQLEFYSERKKWVGYPPLEMFFDRVREKNVKWIIVDTVERTQPMYAFQQTATGLAFWYPYFLGNESFPFVTLIQHEGNPVAAIYQFLPE